MTAINPLISPHLPFNSKEESSFDLSENPAIKEEFAPPKLLSPDQVSSSFQFLQAINGFCDLRESMMQTATVRLQGMKNTLTENSHQIMQQLKNAAEQAQSSQSWQVQKKVASSLSASLCAISGLTLLATGSSALVGGSLIASGILSVSNLVLTESKGWDWIANQLAKDCEETKQKINSLLPSAVGILAAGFGLIGSVHGITSGALNFTEKAGSIAQTALSLFSGATHLGQGIAESTLTWTQAELLSSQEHLQMKQDDFERLSDNTHLTLEEFSRTFRNAKKAIHALTKTQSQLTR